MSMYWWSILVILCYKVERTLSFPAYEIPTETDTMSHSAITMDAIFRTTATFLDRMQLVNDTEQSPFLKVSNYFGSDQESFQRFIQIIHEISGYESLVKREHANDSKYHVNGEQIEMAHILIRQIRNRIVDFSNNSAIVKSNISLIREDVATILYIIQEFYSNTNWIELYGNNTIYEDFGQDNVILKAVADSNEDTCTNCISGNGIEQCENNTLTGSNLTSGYRSDQRITKPVRYLNGINGKCSHGTPDDTSRTFTATGGIYKGRSSQNEAPHSYLHSAAAKLAIRATEYYLTDEAKGLLKLIGSDVFRDIFGIRSREEMVKSSLTFVIDVASSTAAADISMIKSAIEKIVIETTFLPEKYALVAFSDSASSTTENSTNDFQILVSWLDNITVSSGGDCTESAMIGIRKGIELSNDNSKIYILTGARETNASLKTQVINGLKAKHLIPIYVLTGNCSRQTQEDVYANIAKETGGKVYKRNTSEVKTVIETEIKETLPSSNVFITWFKMPANTTHNRSIPVDEYTTTLVITVTPVTSMSEVVLYNPNGAAVSLSANVETDLLNNVSKISILNPEPGQWILQKNGTDSLTVNVTAQSAMDFSASILEKSAEGNSYQLTGNPIKENQYSVVVDIPNLNSTSNCSMVALLCDSGIDVFEFNVTGVRLNGITRYIGDFVPSNKSLNYIQIRGNDDKGNRFLRTRSIYIKPVSVQLYISPLFGNLRFNTTSNISFSLTKTDENFDGFNITVSDGNNDIGVQQEVRLVGEQVYVVMVTPTSLQTLILHFLITHENFKSAIQTKTRRYSVMDTHSANCIVKQYPGKCPLESLNTENCTSYNWTGSVEVSSATIRESVIKVSNNEVILNHTDLKDANSSVPIILSGHCCIQTVVLTIIDTNGNFDECSFILSEQPVTIVQYPSTSTSSSTTTDKQKTTIKKQTTVAETSSYQYVTTIDEQEDTSEDTGFNKETGGEKGNSRIIGIALGFTFLGLTLVGIIICIVCRIKKRLFTKHPVAFLSYQTLKIKNENDHDVNEMLDKCHELHTGDHVTTENEINSSSLQKCENKENNDGNNSSSFNDTDCIKEKPETSENKTSEAVTSDSKNKENTDDKKVTSINSDSGTINAAKAGLESSDTSSINGVKIKEDDKLKSSSDHEQKDTSNLSSESNISEDSTNKDDKKVTSINSDFGTIYAAKTGPESSDSINGDKFKEDYKRESSSDHGQKESLSTESNVLKDSQNPNLGKGNDFDSQTVTPDNLCPENKLENNENGQTAQVVQTGKDKEVTKASSEEHE